MSRRLNFLHYILKLDKSEILSKFYYSQKYNPSNNDWIYRIRKDMDILNINLTDEEIESYKKVNFKNYVKNNVNNKFGCIEDIFSYVNIC